MKKLLIISILGLLTTSLLTAEGGVEFSGNIETLWGLGAPWTDSETSAGHFTLGTTNFTSKLDAYYNNSSAYVEASLSYDAVNQQNENSNNGFELSLNELWLDYTESVWGIRIGRQKAAWGKADGIDITNVLCPTDMSSLAAMTSDDSKIAVDAIRLSLSGNQFTADAYWIPFFTPAALPLNQDNSRRKFILPSSINFPITPEQFLTLPVNIGLLDNPDLTILNGEYGLRISGYFSAFDLSLYGFYGWDDTPLLDYTLSYNEAQPPYPPMPKDLSVSGKYERMSMIGVDAALPIGATVLRLESAFFPQRHLQKSAEKIIQEKMQSSSNVEVSEKHNQISALAGIDWMPDGWTITAQYYCDLVFGNLDNLERTETYMHGTTLSLSKSLVNETLELSFSGLLGLNDFDSMLSPSVKYRISDQITFGANAYIFIPGPDRDGKYGAYKDLSSFCINAKFSF